MLHEAANLLDPLFGLDAEGRALRAVEPAIFHRHAQPDVNSAVVGDVVESGRLRDELFNRSRLTFYFLRTPPEAEQPSTPRGDHTLGSRDQGGPLSRVLWLRAMKLPPLLFLSKMFPPRRWPA